jgi:enamine deaminase RidA (YjgF/YER057c/UK114 family)
VSADARLAELGIELPEPPRPPFAPRLRSLQVHNGLGYLSGNGVFDVAGRVGDDVSVAQAQDAAGRAALQLLRVIRDELGSLDAVERWVKVLGFVRSAPGFADQPAVLNGFTEQVVAVYGAERGLCARSAIGVSELPAGIAVEVEAIVALR